MNPVKEMPGGIETNEDDVINRILSMDFQKEATFVRKFKKKYVSFGGHATEQCVNIIFKNARINR